MTDGSDPDRRVWLLAQLRAASDRLSWPADDQIKYLCELGPGDIADELALELEDVREAVIAEGLLSAQQESLLQALDAQLESMSGTDRGAMWTAECLQSDEAWVEVRRLASGLQQSLADETPPAES